MKVAASARHNFRKALHEFGYDVNIEDSQADTFIRDIRKTLQKTLTGGDLQAQAGLLVTALAPVRDFLVNAIEDDEPDDASWSSVLWDVLTAAINGTKAAASCPELLASEPAWEDTMALLTARPTASEIQVTYPVHLRRQVVALYMLIISLLIFLVPSAVNKLGSAFNEEGGAVISGRQTLLIWILGFLFFCAGIIWWRLGWHLGALRKEIINDIPASPDGDDVDARSSVSSSVRLRAQKDKLAIELEQLKQSLNTASGEVPCEKGELMAAMIELAQAQTTTTGEAAERSAEAVQHSAIAGRALFVGDVVRVSGAFLSAGGLRGQNGVLGKLYSDRSADVLFPSGDILYMVPLAVLEVSCLPAGTPPRDQKWFCEQLARLVDNVRVDEEDDVIVAEPAERTLHPSTEALTNLQAHQVQRLLGKHGGSDLSQAAQLDPLWHRRFWREVANIGGKTEVIKALLVSHGYLGGETQGPPRAGQLRAELQQLFTAGQGVPYQQPPPEHVVLQVGKGFDEDEELEQLLNPNQLPAGMRRAAPEIYTSIVSNGSPNLIGWLNEQFPVTARDGNKEYLSFFNSLKPIDMELSKLGARERLAFLNSNDSAEIALRHLSSFVHERRTGDREAASSMLALRPSGTRCDIAPTWLISDASNYSQQEFKRRQRASDGSGVGKGRGKGGEGRHKGQR